MSFNGNTGNRSTFSLKPASSARTTPGSPLLPAAYTLSSPTGPGEYRAAAWSQAYAAYQELWKQQGAVVDKLPVHIRGELLGGLAVSAMRTGRDEEAMQASTRYSPCSPTLLTSQSLKWKANPKAAADTSITCMTCHEQGLLAARLNAINNK